MSETWRIIIGYGVNAVYLLLVVLLGEFLNKKCNVDSLMSRKIEHLLTGANWIIVYIFFGASIHLFLFAIVSFIALVVLTFGVKLESANREGAEYSLGLIYYGISAMILSALVVFVNNAWYPLYGIAYYCLALGDGLAPIVGKAVKEKYNPEIFPGKTLFGTLTVFVICFLAVLIFNLIFDMQYSVLFLISVASLASMMEIYGAKGTDNLTIPLIVFLYLVLHSLGQITFAIELALALSILYVPICGISKSLTFGASFVAFIYVMGTAFFGGLEAVVMVFALYIIAAIVSAISTKKFNQITKEVKAKTIRKSKQIFANSSVAFVLTIIYFITKETIFLFASFAVLAEEFADSLASDIGRLSKHHPIDILKFKKVKPGISGGISLLGVISALISSFIATSIPFAFFITEWKALLVVLGVSFVGMFIDSILGSSLQVLYRCPVCGEQTEKPIHCNVTAEQIKGCKVIDNSMVNLLTGVLTGGLAIVFLMLV